jgi:hypothetical protein
LGGRPPAPRVGIAHPQPAPTSPAARGKEHHHVRILVLGSYAPGRHPHRRYVYDVYDRRRKGARTEFSKNAPATGGETAALAAATQHRNILNNTQGGI